MSHRRLVLLSDFPETFTKMYFSKIFSNYSVPFLKEVFTTCHIASLSRTLTPIKVFETFLSVTVLLFKTRTLSLIQSSLVSLLTFRRSKVDQTSSGTTFFGFSHQLVLRSVVIELLYT